MKNILISLFVFLFTLGITIYNFYRGAYVFGWITVTFATIDFVLLVITIIRRISR